LIFKIFPILFLISTAVAFDKDLKTINDRVPLEFNLLFESMKIQIKSDADKIRFIGLCKELNENLGLLEKENIFLLMKSEVIKNVLEYKHEKVRSFDVTTFLISRIEEDFSKKQMLLTPFSQWIWRSIIAELKHREKMGLISSRSFNPGTFQGATKVEAKRLARYLTYLLPWIDKMNSLSAAEFNDLTKKVSWVILTRLNQRSLLFKRFASTATTDAKIVIFNIPGKLLEFRPDEIKRMQGQEMPKTLKEQSEKEKSTAFEQIQNLTPDDLSPLSDEVSKELDQKAP
jgi:hypothetical protein